MTLNQIEYFYAIARRENFRAAAEVLHVSQPSLSRSIATLEEELGVSLFQKEGRGIKLTKAGHLFYDYASQILHDCKDAVEKMEEIASGGGTIDLGYVFPLAGYFIPHHVREFLNLPGNENVKFTFYQNHTPNIVQKIHDGDLDLGFGGCVEKLDLDYFPVTTQEMVIAVPEDHPLAKCEDIPFKELENYPVIGYDKESWMGIQSRRLYQEFDVDASIIVECPDEYSILSLVRENFGIALIPRTDICDDITGIAIRSIADHKIAHQIMMFWMKDREHLPVIDRFIAYMKEKSTAIEDSLDQSTLFLKDMIHVDLKNDL